MTFRFRKKEGVVRGIHRVVREQTALAVGLLADRAGDLPKRIHEARRCLKRLRATLRLVRTHMDGDTNDAKNMALRNAGRKLSGARDAEVVLATFERLVPGLSGPGIARIRAVLKAAVRKTISPRQLAAIAAAVRASGHTIARMSFAENGWPLIAPGLAKSYASARHTARTLRDDTEIETIHEWRKATKRLLYQLELIRRALGKPQRKILRRLGELCEILGEHHDLHTLATHPATAKSPALKNLIAHELTHRLKLARRLAKEIFARRPRSFLAALRASWNEWRG